jgi:hypothetical protein
MAQAQRYFAVSFNEKKGFSKHFAKIPAADDARALEWAKVQAKVFADKLKIKIEKINIKIEEVALTEQSDKT